jgi:nitroreductase
VESALNVIEAILSRRSIRKFQKRSVEERLILQILDAARHAPSSRNSQPWEFIVVRKHETLSMLSMIHQYAWLLKDAPIAIIVVANESLSPRRYIQDCSAAIQNLLLAAHGLGLGCCWVAVHSLKDTEVEEKVKGIVPMPEDRRVVAIIAIGYPDYTPSEKKMRNLDKIIHWENW